MFQGLDDWCFCKKQKGEGEWQCKDWWRDCLRELQAEDTEEFWRWREASCLKESLQTIVYQRKQRWWRGNKGLREENWGCKGDSKNSSSCCKVLIVLKEYVDWSSDDLGCFSHWDSRSFLHSLRGKIIRHEMSASPRGLSPYMTRETHNLQGLDVSSSFPSMGVFACGFCTLSLYMFCVFLGVG